MKKVIILTLALGFIAFVAISAYFVYLGFTVARPTTDAINKEIVRDLSGVIIVPQGIAPPMHDFDQTVYSWEMETPAKEVTGVTFSYTPSFSSKSDKIIATLEMPENGDPSIFNKVLEAIIVDRQSLDAARSPEKADLNANSKAGYSSIRLAVSPKNNQTTRITWEFKKKNLSPELNKLYQKLNYPGPVLKFLYKIPGFVIDLFRG